ncbi:MAG: hypothetical protein ACLSB9_28060 [Hydrogeniiclostridium mannosilyticum]
MSGSGGSDGGRPTAGYCYGGIPLFQRPAGSGGKEAEAYLTSPDMGRGSACLIYAYANLPMGQAQRARFALGELNASLAAAAESRPSFGQRRLLARQWGRCFYICRCRRESQRLRAFCLCCRLEFALMPCM